MATLAEHITDRFTNNFADARICLMPEDTAELEGITLLSPNSIHDACKMAAKNLAEEQQKLNEIKNETMKLFAFKFKQLFVTEPRLRAFRIVLPILPWEELTVGKPYDVFPHHQICLFTDNNPDEDTPRWNGYLWDPFENCYSKEERENVRASDRYQVRGPVIDAIADFRTSTCLKHMFGGNVMITVAEHGIWCENCGDMYDDGTHSNSDGFYIWFNKKE